MIPKIDYVMLGQAVEHYKDRGFTYVEVPWAVEEHAIRATLPDHVEPMQLAIRNECIGGNVPVYGAENYLVGSAEQGFISLHLPPGRYVGVTPCFRREEANNLFYQDMFMKVELFSNQPTMKVEEMVKAAESFFHRYSYGLPKRVSTSEGIDLTLAGIEIGSYGEREHDDIGRWVYGTGLALPRFSVANAVAHVL